MAYPPNNTRPQISYLIAFALFALWVVMFLVSLTSKDISITTIEQRHKPVSTYTLPLRLEKSDIYRQEITAAHDNLGQIAVRFQTHLRINDDELIFRIRSSDSKNWDYTSTIKTDQFQPDQLFPFGFPIYPDSKNQTYIWEIESVRGDQQNFVSISKTKPVIVSRYQFSKTEMAQDEKKLAVFIINKFLNVIQDPDSLLNLILWGSPLFIFLIATSTKKIYKNFLFVAIIPFTILIIDSLYVTTNHDLVTLLLFCFWLAIFFHYRPPRTYLVGLSLFSLVLSLILNLLGNDKQSGKSFIWFLLFLLLFIINDSRQNFRHPKLSKQPKQAKK